MSERRVYFTSVVVFDSEDAVRGVTMTCLECGEHSWWGPEAQVAHAAQHTHPGEFVTISRSLLNHLEAEAGL